MISDHQKIQRLRQPGLGAGAGGDFLTQGKPIGRLRPEPIAQHAGIGRVSGMQMGVAEEDAIGMRLADVGRIFLSGTRPH